MCLTKLKLVFHEMRQKRKGKFYFSVQRFSEEFHFPVQYAEFTMEYEIIGSSVVGTFFRKKIEKVKGSVQ